VHSLDVCQQEWSCGSRCVPAKTWSKHRLSASICEELIVVCVDSDVFTSSNSVHCVVISNDSTTIRDLCLVACLSLIDLSMLHMKYDSIIRVFSVRRAGLVLLPYHGLLCRGGRPL
jgi:hypothetical protein